MALNHLLLLLLSSGCFLAKDLPSDIQKCKPGDVACIAKVATDLISKSGNGRQDLGIPAYEPFNVDNLVLQEESNRPVSLQLSLKDIIIRGISGIVVERAVGFEKDPTTSKFEIYSKVPKLHINGLYKSNGRVLLIPVRGEGSFDMTLEDVKISIKFKPEVIEKDGQHFVDVQKMKILIEPQGAKIHLERFVEESNPLGDSINQFLNDNWRDFWTEIYPPISDAMLNIIRNIIQEPLKIYSYDNIFLPD